MEDESRSMPGATPIPVGLIILGVVIYFIWRSRRKSKSDRALDRVRDAINDTDLPERAKDLLLTSVEEVRDALLALRSKANELTG